MKLDALDRLISDLANESVSVVQEEHVRGLMADASALLAGYRLQCRTSLAIELVLNQAQVICEAAVPTTEMIGVLRQKGKGMQEAARAVREAVKASKLPAVQETPEAMAKRITDNCGLCSVDFAQQYIAAAIRLDRLVR